MVVLTAFRRERCFYGPKQSITNENAAHVPNVCQVRVVDHNDCLVSCEAYAVLNVFERTVPAMIAIDMNKVVHARLKILQYSMRIADDEPWCLCRAWQQSVTYARMTWLHICMLANVDTVKLRARARQEDQKRTITSVETDFQCSSRLVFAHEVNHVLLFVQELVMSSTLFCTEQIAFYRPKAHSEWMQDLRNRFGPLLQNTGLDSLGGVVHGSH